ncbi:hypothetical protein LV478_14955 [Komagataeibacter oboediens]|uniref:hypothetical protein n=1 Tax=Komagataeibacter oboediens TaxID=65958 RepID=UPI0023DA6C23|nr:hypothetical protein [Komagataeibacter oboediens]WEQ51790.1 hypothetical protein LV478_14955 [Komagataeibacter oboediens]
MAGSIPDEKPGSVLSENQQALYSLDAVAPRMEGMLFQVTAQNLLNQRYYPGCAGDDTGCHIGANRNVIGKVMYSWQ